MKKLAYFGFLVLAAAAFGQDVFAPFVSRIQSAHENGRVVVSWEDSQDVSGTYRVYRSSRIISEASFSDAEFVGEVPSGQGFYADRPAAVGTYYYAVLIVGGDGTEYEVFIPYRNVVVNPVQVTEIAVETDSYEAVTVSDINVSVNGSRVNVSFRRDIDSGDLVLLQSTAPIASSPDATRAVVVAILNDGDTAFADAPVPATSYYYAVLDLKQYESGQVSITPGANATVSSVEVPLGDRIGLSYFKPTSDMPLPYLTLRNAVLTGDDLANPLAGQFAEKQDLSLDTEKYLSILLERIPATASVDLGAVILPADRVLSSDPEVRALQGVLQAEFDAGNWTETIDALGKYLTFDRDAEVEARAHFYLGQCFFFTEDYYSAIREFLFAESAYYAKTQIWLEQSYRKLQ